jgi:hypothetical protein
MLPGRLPSLAGALRDWRYKRDLGKSAKRNAYPDTVQRKYWTQSEYERDAVRLIAQATQLLVRRTQTPTSM